MTEPRRAIIYVPGKSPKPPPAIHRGYLLRCLKKGVSRSDPAISRRLQEGRFVVAGWNFLYYQRHEPLVSDIPWIERLISSDGAAPEDIREARHWSKWLARLMYTLGDHAHWLIHYLPDPRIRAMIEDTLRYFDNTDGVAERIRTLVKEEIQLALDEFDSVCVIGHSMGSVVAYEALWELTHLDRQPPDLDLFLTLGSPLGMNYVQKRLLGLRNGERRFPRGIRKWINVSAVGDLVSVDEDIADDFAPMLESGCIEAIEDRCRDVYTAFRNENGLNPHRSYGYLVHPMVGDALARWWRGGDR